MSRIFKPLYVQKKNKSRYWQTERNWHANGLSSHKYSFDSPPSALACCGLLTYSGHDLLCMHDPNRLPPCVRQFVCCLKWRFGRKFLRSMGIDFGKNHITIRTTQSYYCGRGSSTMVTRTTRTRKKGRENTSCERLQISTCTQARARTELRTEHSKLWNESYKEKKPTTTTTTTNKLLWVKESAERVCVCSWTSTFGLRLQTTASM